MADSKKMAPKDKVTAPSASKTDRKKVSMVAIGASAGGLEPFERFFDAMPVNSDIAFVIIQHLSPDFESMMDELLSRHSSMDIERVVNELRVKPNTIYLNPPRSKMIIKNGKFILQDKPESRELNLPIDIFFDSFAQEYGREAIAIVLSGTGSDGTRGAAMIKGHEGTVLVQTPASAKFDGMPRSVIESGNFDAMATPSEMPTLIKRIRDGKTIDQSYTGEVEDDPEKHIFLRLRDKYGTDFGYYKEATLTRRFERRATLAGTDLIGYAKRLATDADELDALYADMLIDVTSFFRDIKGFKAITKHAIEPLAAKMTHDKQIRVWVAGCSSGEEAYSFAIAFAEHARENNIPLNLKILATDVHQRSLGAAAEGLYPKSSLTGLSEEQIERYFEKHVDYYQVRQQLRRLVVFSRHNLLRDPPFTRMDLVSCRNVMIYFKEQAQQKTLALFHFALRTDAFLFLGPSESLGRLEDEFETLDRRWKIYKKLRDVRLLEATSLLPRDSANRPKPEFTPPYLTGRTGTLQRFQKAHGEALEMMLKDFAPPGFLLNKKGEIVHVFGNAGSFVSIDGGVFSNLIVDLIHPQLKLAVMTGLERLTAAEKLTFERRVIMTDDDNIVEQSVVVSLKSLSESTIGPNHFLLTLVSSAHDRLSEQPLPEFLDAGESSQLLQNRIKDLERDLGSTEQSLQALVEELQTSNEELQATNEELMASNEELQSANEELHSVNEELYTVSSEHQRKIDELTVLSDDMNLLLHATSIGILFLGENLHIRRFTPSAAEVFNLMVQDINRPFAHTTYKFQDKSFQKKVKTVLKTKEPHSQEVTVEGKTYILNILPYVTAVKEASGVVITMVEITALKAAERARIAEKEIYETVLNDLSEAVFRVRLSDGALVTCNQLFIDRYCPELSLNQVIGKTLEDVVDPEFKTMIFDRAKDKKVGELTTVLMKRDGLITSGHLRLLADEKGEPEVLQATAMDITAQYRYTEALEEILKVEEVGGYQFDETVDLEKLLEIGRNYLNLPYALITKTDDDKSIITHARGFDGFPKEVDALTFYKLEDAMSDDADSLVMTHVENNMLKNDLDIKDYISVRILTYREKYGVMHFAGTVGRKTVFTDMERTVVQLLSRLAGFFLDREMQLENIQRRQTALENVNEGLNRFTYLASHDLQEPLRKIQQSGEMLHIDTEGLLDEDSAYFLKIMIEASGRMRSLIDDLLLYSASANQDLAKDDVDLGHLVERAISDLQGPINDSSATINVEPLPVVACDPVVMKQVFVNILSNSLKYRDAEKSPEIIVSATVKKSETHLSFKDNGIGMELDGKIDIFEPFIRLHSKTVYSGSGIGLAICKTVCDRHGWEIDVKSKLDEGTEVIFIIRNSEITHKSS